jgi:hypothetical protein
MTGVQALERKFPDLTMTPGQAARREVEYIRQGTLCFIVSRDGVRPRINVENERLSW